MQCHYCGQDKPLSDFFPLNKSRCRDCIKAYEYTWKHSHPEYRKRYRVYEKRYRETHKEQMAQYYKDWYQRKGRKRDSNYADTIILWRQQNPEKVQAINILNRAVKQGIIQKLGQCQDCGRSIRVIAHHSDYSKPLEVIWLCASCHKKLHLASP